MHGSLPRSACRTGLLPAPTALVSVAMAGPAHAIDIKDASPLIGIAAGQVARLSTINLGGPDTKSSCQVTLSVLDDEGNILGIGEPNTLPPGKALAVEVSALKAG